ncbi:methyltransferase [Paramagnetospirillum marisnigri]|uniref:Methyltransferase n=1 Tax=Paramagnetospirillum marisnigri TaxID=1285242 RepID=A0A178MH62_9PROT|nr:SAM-dependent methyltransferase [Paramagnetospirillum marisnigri]OAN48019.1 methyltransferase [Paramagnetospirillum marisnigri]
MTFTAYLAAPGFEADLRAELGEVMAEHGRLLLAEGPPRPAAWAANIWLEPQRLNVASIGEAAKALKAIQRNWWPHEFHLHRRTALLVDKLPKVSAKPLEFGQPAPTAPLGSFCWLDENTVLASARCSSPFPNGEAAFIEDRHAPPNRAYLKLWEALTLAGEMPRPGQTCLDLGASPGGWTWVLASTGARVISVDKAPLAPAIAAMPNVECRQESAFGLEPGGIGPVDWLCSDVICYPERLLRLVERWLDSGLARNFICTLKFQGETDHATAQRFAAIPGSRLLHLSHNKHELTWMRITPALA